MPARFSEVVPNKLYRGGLPADWEIPELKDKFGIQQIISLDKKGGEKIDYICKKNGIIHKIIPINADNPRDPELEQIKVGVSNIIDDKITYVHCHHGKDRTGLFIAKYRTENGYSCKEALDEAISFGFGIGEDESAVKKYINIIVLSCKEKHKHVDIGYYFLKIKKAFLCIDCGLIKQNNFCESCFVTDGLIKNAHLLSKNITNEESSNSNGKNIVDKERETKEELNMLKGDEALGGGTEVSTVFCPPGSITASRKQRVNILKNINKIAQQISFKIPTEERKQAKACIEKLDDLVEHILLKAKVKEEYVDLLDVIYNPFNENSGLTQEQAKKLKGYLEIFVKILNNNMIQIKSFAVFALNILEEFKSDADVASMNKSFFDEVDNLDKEEKMFEKILENIDDKDFQKNVVNAVKVLKKSSAQLKQLINERIIPYLRKDILGDDWTTEIKETLQEDKQEAQKEQK